MVKGSSNKKLSFRERLPGIIQGIKKSIRKKKQKINKKIFESKDFKVFINVSFGILMDGLLVSALLYPFFGFEWLNILIYGAGWYFLKNQLLTELKQLISSINLIRVGK
ncbi:MAG: hypothetical protein ACOC1X_00090 [Promethearchaeota archaeon]